MKNIHSKDQLRLIDFQYVLEVCKKQNISLAADALGTTQSAISYAIKRMESAYGLTLFERKNRGVIPLPSAYKFIKEAENILNSSEQIAAIRMDSSSQGISTIRIGICRLYERYYSTTLLNVLARSFPDLNVSISSGHFQELYSDLMNKKIDVIFTPITHSIPGLLPVPLFMDNLLFIAPSGSNTQNHSLQITGTGSFHFTLSAVLPRKSSQLHALCSELLGNYLHGSLEIIEADSFYTVVSYANARIGGGFIPASIKSKLELDPHIQVLSFPENVSSYPVGVFAKKKDSLIISIFRQLNIPAVC